MLDGLIALIGQVLVEGLCYGIGKVLVAPVGFTCSLDDQWGMRKRKRGPSRPPWHWRHGNRRHLRSDVVQMIGLMVLLFLIATACAAWFLTTGSPSAPPVNIAPTDAGQHSPAR